jgi:hypothetical protein
MTQLLNKAISEAAKLPEQEQDALASILLAEIESEERWTETFAKSQDLLAELAGEAKAEHAAGKTLPF